ncbi:hypothetical protein AB0G04_40815 [Actinoplanes sp. NPDC023801]
MTAVISGRDLVKTYPPRAGDVAAVAGIDLLTAGKIKGLPALYNLNPHGH